MKQRQLTVFSGALIKEGKVLMVQRSEVELPEAHLRWEFPGGKVDFDEKPEEALVREFKEETGREIRVLTLLPFVQTVYWEYAWGKQQTFGFVFLCELVADNSPMKKDHHVEKIAWIQFDEVEKLNTLPGTNEIMRIIKKHLGL